MLTTADLNTASGLVISALVPSVEIALALGPPAIIIALLFGGFYSKSWILSISLSLSLSLYIIKDNVTL